MPRTREKPSPDPLELTSNQSDADCIEAAPAQPEAGPSQPRSRSTKVTPQKPKSTRTPKSSTAKKQEPVVEILTPSKKSHYSSLLPPPSTSFKRKLLSSPVQSSHASTGVRTPLARASPAANRQNKPSTPSKPSVSAKGKEKALPSSTKRARERIPSPSPLKKPGSNVPLSAKRRKVGDTPVRNGQVNGTVKDSANGNRNGLNEENHFDIDDSDDSDDVLVDENGYIRLPAAPVSRETFLANEKLRRQREARNFKYTGSADAPKLTRSGKVIGRISGDTEEESTPGPDPDDPFIDHPTPLPIDHSLKHDDEIRQSREQDIADQEEEDEHEIIPLPEGAERCVKDILDGLTGRRIAFDPPPFPHEETNEVLSGLVSLLKGTVERGEGNSALITGAGGVGKTRTIARALQLLPSSSKTSPIVVRLSGLAQTNDRLAIKEMGRQIAEAEGKMIVSDPDEDEDIPEDAEYAPTTLPSHLLALLTSPSPRAIIIIMEEFDLFTEHARQALLYCLLDVVQSVKTGPVESTGRGVAVIGVTSRVDTLLLLEKRVKSRFSHRMWRVISPLSPDGLGWKELLVRAIVPWRFQLNVGVRDDLQLSAWKEMWEFAIQTLLEDDKVNRNFDRLCGLTTDVRLVYRPFILPITNVLAGSGDFISVSEIRSHIISQLENASWGLANKKLKGLPQPSVGVLIIAKHLYYTGREEITFAMVEEEYLKFGRTKLVGSGRTRWPITILRSGYDHLIKIGLLVPSSTGNIKPRFAKVRCTLSPHDIVAWMKGDGAAGLGPEMVGWGRMTSGHL